MEVLVLLGLCAAGVIAAVLALKLSFWVLAFVILPLFWLWMLIDAITRREGDYPSKSTNEKILWIVLILLVHVSVVVYWFMVYRPARRRAGAPAAPVYGGTQAAAPNPPTCA